MLYLIMDSKKAVFNLEDQYIVDTVFTGGDDQYLLETWRANWQGRPLHRVHGPAEIMYDISNMKIVEKKFYNNNMLHQEVGPARLFYDVESGVTVREEFYQYDKLHNIDGPAIIVRNNKTGEIIETQYFVNGVESFPKDGLVSSADFEP